MEVDSDESDDEIIMMTMIAIAIMVKNLSIVIIFAPID